MKRQTVNWSSTQVAPTCCCFRVQSVLICRISLQQIEKWANFWNNSWACDWSCSFWVLQWKLWTMWLHWVKLLRDRFTMTVVYLRFQESGQLFWIRWFFIFICLCCSNGLKVLQTSSNISESRQLQKRNSVTNPFERGKMSTC